MAVQGVESALPGVEQLRRVAMPLSGGSVIMYVGIRAINDQVNIHGLPEFDISILQLSGQEVEDVNPVLATGPEHGRQVIGQAVAPGEPSSDHGVLPSDEIHRVKAEVRLDDVLHHLFVVTSANRSVDKTANSVVLGQSGY
ncbi:hypothetical protein PG984_013059 [Apiospora sp. TS-2023a]